MNKLLVFALLLALTMPAFGQNQPGGGTSVSVRLQAEPATCVQKVVAFSNTRNSPVRMSPVGEGLWVSEPVPKDELLTIAYETVQGCTGYTVINEQTLEKFYNVDRISLYASYNATLIIKAVKYEPPPPDTGQNRGGNPYTALFEQAIRLAPTVAAYSFVPVIAYTAYRVSRRMVHNYRRRVGERRATERMISWFREVSSNPIVKNGWLWMDIDPASEVISGTDPDRRIAAYLKLARILPAGRDRMDALYRETRERMYTPTVMGARGAYTVDPGEDLIWYAVELARDDPEIDGAIARIERAGADPYTIPRELAGIDILIKTYRGRPMEELGFRYSEAENRGYERCPYCGGKTIVGAKFCTTCGRGLPAAHSRRAPATMEQPQPALEPPPPTPQKKQSPMKWEDEQETRPQPQPRPEPETKQPIPEPPVKETAPERIIPVTPPKRQQEPAVKMPPTKDSRPAPAHTDEALRPKPVEEAAAQLKPVEEMPTPKQQDQPVEVVWEPDEDTVEALEDMGVGLDSFRNEVLRLAAIDEADRAYERELMRSADRVVASMNRKMNDDFRVQLILSVSQYLRDAAFVARKFLKPPEKPPKVRPTTPLEKPSTPPQEALQKVEPGPAVKRDVEPVMKAETPPPTPEPATGKPVEVEVTYGELRKGLQQGHVYIIDLPRSALPTSVVTCTLKGALNAEKTTAADPGSIVALTRTTYRANYKSPVRPSPNHPYVRRLARLLANVGGAVVTEEVYRMLEQSLSRLKPVRVRLETDKTVELLKSRGFDVGVAERLGKLFTLLPEEAVGIFVEEGLEAFRKKLAELLGPEDGDDIYDAVKAALYGDRYPNKSLMISLGMMPDEAG